MQFAGHNGRPSLASVLPELEKIVVTQTSRFHKSMTMGRQPAIQKLRLKSIGTIEIGGGSWRSGETVAVIHLFSSDVVDPGSAALWTDFCMRGSPPGYWGAGLRRCLCVLPSRDLQPISQNTNGERERRGRRRIHPGRFYTFGFGSSLPGFQRGRVWLSYERKSGLLDRQLKGHQELKYFIGSGKRGRTFLFERDGYWFEAPINWYAKKRIWDMAPNYGSVREMPLTLPVDPGCLHCHASDVARLLPEARNRYSGEPFGHTGVRCSACHGDGGAHVASSGRVPSLRLMN